MKWLWPGKSLAEIETTIAIRLGRVLHWTAIALAGLLWLGEFVGVAFGYWSSSQFTIGVAILAGIALFFIGRGLRYIFSNE